MGEVYKAHDGRLNRTVAIKRMMADDASRFQSETRAIAAMGESPMPLWGPVAYYLLTSNLDRAADWYERMIEARDPFALVYASASMVEPLRRYPRWPALAARMNLPRESGEPGHAGP